MGCGSSKQAKEVADDKANQKVDNVATRNDATLNTTGPFASEQLNSTLPLTSPATAQSQTDIQEDLAWKLDEEEILTQHTHKELEKIKDTACREFGVGNSILKGRVSIFDTKKGWFATPTGAFSPGNFMEASVPKLQYDRFQKNQDNSVLTYTDMRKSEFANRPAVKHRPHMTFRSGILLISRLAKQPHPLGYLFVWDSKPGEELTPQQISRFEELALEAVSALQKRLLKAIGVAAVADTLDGASQQESTQIEGTTIELPAVWVDINTKDWKILGINKQWEMLTGIGVDTLQNSSEQYSGLLRIMGPADGSSTSELRQSITSAAADVAPECSIPAIISPRSPAGASLQYAVAVKRATAPPPIAISSSASLENTENGNDASTAMWMVEVHVRVQGDTHGPSHDNSLSAADVPESVRLSWQSAGSGGSSGSYHQVAYHQQFGGAIGRGSSDLTGGGGSTSLRGGRSIDFGSRVPGKALSLSIANDILPGIPPRLANLRFGPILGSGSYADVYSGYLGYRPVAIKVIEIPDTRKSKKDWGAHYEALLAVEIKHPNVITTYDWSRIEEPRGWQVWIVQEQCDHGSLSQMIESGGFMVPENNENIDDDKDGEVPGPNLPVVLETVREVARGMRYLHSIGEVHADLSSNNVLLTSADNSRGFLAKVTDFGLSKLGTSKHITKTWGTVTYMPPEVLLEGIVSKSADVYAFGVMFWEMVSGRRAWTGLTTPQVIFAVGCREQKLELPSEGKVPHEVVEILQKCMATEASERPSFEEVCTELDTLLDKLQE